MRSPRVSIIIPTYNYAHLISEAIESVLQSEYPTECLEIIIVDDGSTDKTEEIVQKFQEKVLYFRQDNQGKASATRYGIEIATGEYLFNLDADDLFLPEKIRRVVDIFNQDPDIVHVSHPCWYWEVDRDLKTIESIPELLLNQKVSGLEILDYFYTRRILYGGGSTFAARTSILKKLSIPTSVDMFIDEYLVIFAIKEGFTYFLDTPLSLWRIHGVNYSDSSVNLMQAKQKRNLSGVESILFEVEHSNLPVRLKRLYQLKVLINQLGFKESFLVKKSSDITDLIRFLIQNVMVFGSDLPLIINSYAVPGRLLSTPLLQFLKRRLKR